MVDQGHCPMISKYGTSLSKAVGQADPSFLVGPNKKIGVVQVTRPSLIFYPPTLNFFSPNFEVEKKNIRKMYQNAHLNEKLNFYAFIPQYWK